MDKLSHSPFLLFVSSSIIQKELIMFSHLCVISNGINEYCNEKVPDTIIAAVCDVCIERSKPDSPL